MKEQKEIISVLDELIETLRDGQQGFRQAAEGVSDPKLKSLFRDYSDQRSRFVTALQTEARKFGEKEPDNDSSAAGALHRGWINLKAAVTGGDEDAILDECFFAILSDLFPAAFSPTFARARFAPLLATTSPAFLATALL